MRELSELILKIEELRANLNQLIKEFDDLNHPDVIDASKKLDQTLNSYQSLLQETLKSNDTKS